MATASLSVMSPLLLGQYFRYRSVEGNRPCGRQLLHGWPPWQDRLFYKGLRDPKIGYSGLVAKLQGCLPQPLQRLTKTEAVTVAGNAVFCL